MLLSLHVRSKVAPSGFARYLSIMPLRITNALKIAGFAARNALPGETVPVLVKASMTSDDPMFHVYIDQISRLYLSKAGVFIDSLFSFLIVLHSDDTADIYLNEEPGTIVEMRSKQEINAGKAVGASDIADIRRLEFPNVQFQPSDRLVYCAKIGWKFGFYFDFRHDRVIDFDETSLELGTLYRRLTFEHVYETLESEVQFGAMLADGWFPFVEIASDEYRLLAAAYADSFDFDARISRVLDTFTPERLQHISGRWWSKPAFGDKRKLLEAGVRSYQQQTEDGYITSIKTLATEVEGILRAQYSEDTGKPGNLKVPALIQHIIDKERARSGSDTSLLLPGPFLRYLRDVVFRNFDVVTGDLVMSRHTVGHGVAKPEDYTRTRALQMILTVDQLWFFS